MKESVENKSWKKRASNYSPEVGDEAWEGIAKNLGSGRGKGVFVVRVAAAIILLLGVILTTVFYKVENDQQPSNVTHDGYNNKNVTEQAKAHRQNDSEGSSNGATNDGEVTSNLKEDYNDDLSETDTEKITLSVKSSKEERNTPDKADDPELKNPRKMRNNSGANKERNPPEPSVQNVIYSVNQNLVKQESNSVANLSNSNLFIDKRSHLGPDLLWYEFQLPSVTSVIHTLPTSDFNEEEKKNRNRSNKLYFDMQAFSSYHRVDPNQEDETLVNYISSDALSFDRIGFRASVGLERALSEKFTYYGGLSMLHQSQTLVYGFTAASTDSLSFNQQADALEIIPVKRQQEASIAITNFSAGMQLGAYYQVVDRGRLKQYFNLETAAHFQLGDRELYGNYQLYVNLAYNTHFAISSKWIFKISPIISYSVLNFAASESQVFELKPYGIGLDVGVKYRF